MLLQLLSTHPAAIFPILKGTPTWVWGLLAALLALGISQLADRHTALGKVVIMPLAMLGLSLYGVSSAFGSSGQWGAVMLAWLLAAALATTLVLTLKPASATRFDAATRSFVVPGSVVPLLLILGIFMTKYVVGVELALQPAAVRDAAFALPVGLLYGAFSGIFMARAAGLLRLAYNKSRTNTTTAAITAGMA